MRQGRRQLQPSVRLPLPSTHGEVDHVCDDVVTFLGDYAVLIG